MIALTQFPFLKRKFEGGQFTRILNRHFPAIVYFAGKAEIPIYNLIEELLSLAFTKRVIALQRFTPAFSYQKIYSEKIPDALPLDSFLKIPSDEQFLIASIIIYLIKEDTLDYGRRCQLNQLNTLLYAFSLINNKKVQVPGIFGIKSNFCTVNVGQNIKNDVKNIQSYYTRNYVRLYKIDEDGEGYVAISKEFMDFIMTIPDKLEQWVDIKLKKMISRFYEQYKKDIVQYKQIVDQVIADHFRKS